MLDIDFYFADPYSSWQRGSNENLNGLIRQYFPKKTNFDTIYKEDVKKVENQLNKRPRKRFGFKTPIQLFNSLTKVASLEFRIINSYNNGISIDLIANITNLSLESVKNTFRKRQKAISKQVRFLFFVITVF